MYSRQIENFALPGNPIRRVKVKKKTPDAPISPPAFLLPLIPFFHPTRQTRGFYNVYTTVKNNEGEHRASAAHSSVPIGHTDKPIAQSHHHRLAALNHHPPYVAPLLLHHLDEVVEVSVKVLGVATVETLPQ